MNASFDVRMRMNNRSRPTIFLHFEVEARLDLFQALGARLKPAGRYRIERVPSVHKSPIETVEPHSAIRLSRFNSGPNVFLPLRKLRGHFDLQSSLFITGSPSRGHGGLNRGHVRVQPWCIKSRATQSEKYHGNSTGRTRKAKG